jgi:hypothetical protein
MQNLHPSMQPLGSRPARPWNSRGCASRNGPCACAPPWASGWKDMGRSMGKVRGKSYNSIAIEIYVYIIYIYIYDDIINDIWWYHQWYIMIGLYHDNNSGIRYIYIILLGYMIILWWYVAIENRGITKTIGNPMGYENTGYLGKLYITTSLWPHWNHG